MELQKSDHAGIQVLHVGGQINANNAKELNAALGELDCDAKLIIDVSRLEYISSSGLGALIMLSERFRKGCGAMAICGPSDPVANIFEIVELGQRVPIVATREEAAEAVGP